MSALGIAYSVAAALVALYGANALLLAILYLRHRTDRRPVPPRPESWPVVTVQLPVYNELHVVKRLIDAVARLDYPRQRLQIQVLDDSTDETTRHAEACVAHHRLRGLDIDILHRDHRQGFKAGALASGLETARGELVAILDADFVPPADFLKRTVPHLVADPDVGFVQARWDHLNGDYSALAHAQTIALDGHFIVEHIGRNRGGLLINFNGTAGVWRREAIVAAGGWQSDTLTEDVDLSFRAQLAGWQALYLPHVKVPAELPPQMAAFKRQQARWSTGAAQCLFKLAGQLWRGRLVGTRHASPPGGAAAPAIRLSHVVPAAGAEESSPRPLRWSARLEALLHLSVWIAHPMSLLLLLLTLPMLLGQVSLTWNLTIFWLVAMGPTFAYALAQHHLYPDWPRRMAYMPVLALLGTGLALSNTVAIARGLLGREVSFRRTPKFHVRRRTDDWQGSRYVLPFEWISIGELALAIYALIAVAAALTVGNYFAVPFLLLYVGGYGYISLHCLWDAWAARRSNLRRHRAQVIADSQAK